MIFSWSTLHLTDWRARRPSLSRLRNPKLRHDVIYRTYHVHALTYYYGLHFLSSVQKVSMYCVIPFALPE